MHNNVEKTIKTIYVARDKPCLDQTFITPTVEMRHTVIQTWLNWCKHN